MSSGLFREFRNWRVCERASIRGFGYIIDRLENAANTCGGLVVNNSLVVIAYDINAKFLRGGEIQQRGAANIATNQEVVGFEFKWVGFHAFLAEPLSIDECAITALGVLDVYLERERVSFHLERGESWVQTFPPSAQISECWRLRTLLSKIPFCSPGTVFGLVCLPIFTRRLLASGMCFGVVESFNGSKWREGIV